MSADWGGIIFKLPGLFGKIAYIRPIAVVAIIAAICLIVISTIEKPQKSTPALTTETSLEQRLGEALSTMKGVGEAKVLINADEGVLVVADGADDIAVRLEIIRAVKALLGIESERIEVMTMGNKE